MLDKQTMVCAENALPGHVDKMPVPASHYVNGRAMSSPVGEIFVLPGHQQAMFGLGCFWGAERKFWLLDGVHLTAVGYAAGFGANPKYEEVCSGQTGHNEVVLVVYDPSVVSYESLLKVFWQSHNPTQGMCQGNDRGTQYRSGIYAFGEQQLLVAKGSGEQYQRLLDEVNYGEITTEIIPAPEFYFAEEYHQQYLAKNPGGYCGLGGTGVDFS